MLILQEAMELHILQKNFNIKIKNLQPTATAHDSSSVSQNIISINKKVTQKWYIASCINNQIKLWHVQC